VKNAFNTRFHQYSDLIQCIQVSAFTGENVERIFHGFVRCFRRIPITPSYSGRRYCGSSGLAIIGGSCCLDVVSGLTDRICLSGSKELKMEISSFVSKECEQRTPGMTEEEITEMILFRYNQYLKI